MKNHLITKSDPRSDSELLKCFVQSRDDASFELLVRRYQRLVLVTCWRVLSQSHDVDDAFQATFIALAKGAHKIRSTESLGVWLQRVAYRTATKMQQAQQRPWEEPMTEMMLDRPCAIDQMAQRYQQQVVDQELDRLPSKYRRPLVLFYFCGRTYREIAGELQLSVAAVESRMRRGLREMRRRVTRRGVSLPAMTVAISVCHELPAGSIGGSLIHQTVCASMGALQQGWFSRLGTQITQSFSQGILLMKLPVAQSIMVATLTVVFTGWALSTSDSNLKARSLPVTVAGSALHHPKHFPVSLVFGSRSQEEGETKVLRLTSGQQDVYESIKEWLDPEVMVLQMTGDLTESQLAAVKQAVQQVTDAARVRIGNHALGSSSVREAFYHQYPKAATDLKNAFHKLVENQVLSRDQLQRYEQDQQIKRELLVDALRATMAARIELQFVPHGDQLQKLQDLVDQWIVQQGDALSNPRIEKCIEVGRVLPQLPQAQLQECLTPEQWEYYSKHARMVGRSRGTFANLWIGFEDDPEGAKAKARELYRQYMSLIRHRLKRELELTDTQERKLEIGGKKVVDQVIDRYVAVHTNNVPHDTDAGYTEWMKLHGDSNNLLAGGNFLDQVLEGILDENQQARFAKLEKTRSELIFNANWSHIVAVLPVSYYTDNRIVLTGEQLRQCGELFKERMESKELFRSYADPQHVMFGKWAKGKLNKADLLAFLNEQQASAVAFKLQLRQ